MKRRPGRDRRGPCMNMDYLGVYAIGDVTSIPEKQIVVVT